ncbi:MAG: hypothetical protein LBM99_03195 [Bacillales bacterium]|jgi:hypothetical protein|nr:hypothetical protein [Bacillales bacterium]
MEVLAYRDRTPLKSSKVVSIMLYFFVLLFIVGGIVIFYFAQSIPSLVYSGYLFIGFAVFFFLFALFLTISTKNNFKGPDELISYDVKTGTLLMNAKEKLRVKENIKDLTNTVTRLARSKYGNYSFGSLFLEFGKRRYTFFFVKNLHEVSTQLLILKDRITH